jgi:hypothetical protein
MKSRIGETESLRKNENKTNMHLLKGTENSVRSNDVSEFLRAGVTRQLEETQNNASTRYFGHFASGNCFVCDPDWCPDYRRRLCRGKGLT